ncbi:hypothetical protein HDE_10766 [Halotydeus destructor]|nr:hypothetical protein HDE_10766 [Halotydeus destructor]
MTYSLLSKMAVVLMATSALGQVHNFTDYPPGGANGTAPEAIEATETSSWSNFATSTADMFRGWTNSLVGGVRGMVDSWRRADGVSDEAAKYPANYNHTKEQVVDIGGRKYLKKLTVYKSSQNGRVVFSENESLEPLPENDAQ